MNVMYVMYAMYAMYAMNFHKFQPLRGLKIHRGSFNREAAGSAQKGRGRRAWQCGGRSKAV